MLRVANLTKGGDAAGIELDLYLHVRGRHPQRAGELSGEVAGRFLRRIDEAVAAVAIPGKDFQQIVIVTFPADAEAIERDALLAMYFDLQLERVRIDVAKVGRPIGEQHDAIDAVGEVMTQRGLVGQVHGVPEIRAALRSEAADLFADRTSLITGN